MKLRHRICSVALTGGLLTGLIACGQAGAGVPLSAEPAQTEALSMEQTTSASAYTPVFPRHEPYGSGIGVHPGRVVWTYDPNSVDWGGEGYWWELDHFNEPAIQAMVEQGITSLAGTEDAASGWTALFTEHNRTHGNSGGYRA